MGQFENLRKQMIDYQLAARGLQDEAVLAAVNAVPREKFVPPELVEFAYHDSPLPIAARQTISQPYIVALMTAALELQQSDRVLEVGTGSGYAAAILAQIAREVYTIERHKILADTARTRLAELGYTNVSVLYGDGTLGWPQYAPFDAIVAAAGGPKFLQHSSSNWLWAAAWLFQSALPCTARSCSASAASVRPSTSKRTWEACVSYP